MAKSLKYVSSHIPAMVNVTLAVPEEVRQRMKTHPEVRWSEVVRRAIIEYLEDLEGRSRTTRQLRLIVEGDGIDLSKITLEQAERYYERARALEWQRISTTRATS